MNSLGFLNVTLFVLITISTVYLCYAAEDRMGVVNSPILKEVEYKKSLFYNRKPAAPGIPGKVGQNGKKIIKLRRLTPNKQSSDSSGIRYVTVDDNQNEKFVRSSASSSPVAAAKYSAEGTGESQAKNSSTASVVVAPSVSSSPESKNDSEGSINPSPSSSTTNNEAQQTAASDRIFIPPYKMPFWGLPYGVYSNGGFINPGLFPFVPGGPGFPPYDGIFGSPFGPGQFPGNLNPFPPGTGIPMDTGGLPIPPMPFPPPVGVPPAAFGQPPLNPTGRRSNGPPPGAFSPGSPMGYYYRRPPPRRPPPKSKKKKKKPKPEPEDEPIEILKPGGGGGGGCSCGQYKPDDDDYSTGYKKYKTTTTTTPDPCPCSATSTAPPPPPPPPRPSYRKEYDEEDHYHHHHHHHDYADDKYKTEAPPCPLSTLSTTTTTTEYVPPSTTTYEKPTTEYKTTTDLPTSSSETYVTKTKKPCKLKHRPPSSTPSSRTVYYEYESPATQVAAPTRKPCPLKARGYEHIPVTDPPILIPAPPPPPPPPPSIGVYQAAPAPAMLPATYQAAPQYQQPQYAVATPSVSTPTAQESQLSHSTILYKPIPQEIQQTPTTVTVPLPFPYVLDNNGMFQPQQTSMQNSQQVTYKVDLTPDLLTKVTTPVVVTQPQQPHQPIVQSIQAHPIQQLTSSGNRQYILDGQQLTIVNSPASSPPQPQVNQQPQSRYLVLDGSSPSTSQINQMQPSSISYPRNHVLQQQQQQQHTPSVLVLRSDQVNPMYEFQQQNNHNPVHQQIVQQHTSSPSPVAVSYIHPNNPVSSSSNYNSSPAPPSEYIVLSGSPSNYDNPSTKYKQSPYRMISTYQQPEPSSPPPPPRRSQHVSSKNEDSKNYIIINRSELEELQKTFTTLERERVQQSPPVVEKNTPPPPDVVHIEFHSKLDDDRDENKPLSFQSENRRTSQNQQKPKLSSVYIDSDREPIAEGSSPFSRIFELNNDDIVSAGRKISVDRDGNGGNHGAFLRTSLVFDKYLKNDHDRMKK